MKTRMNSLSLLFGTGIVAILLFAASNTASAQGYHGGGSHHGGSHYGGGVHVDRSYHGSYYHDYYGGRGGRGHCDHRPVVIVPPCQSDPYHSRNYRPPFVHGQGHFPGPYRR